MLIKLHDRRAEPRARVRGLSCDETGLHFAGDCALIESVGEDGAPAYRRRPIDEINRTLSAGYGAPVDLTAREGLLDSIADHLNRGDLARAQLLALQLRLPDLAGDADIDRLLKADQLLRFNPNHDDKGRFATAPGGARQVGVTSGGTHYSIALRLNAAQSEMLGRIVDYGKAHDFRLEQIAIMVGQAFHESSLGTLEHNPTNATVIGLFQYNARTWHALGHSNLNINNDDDQIIAMYQDLARYDPRYQMRMAQRKIPKDLSFADYLAVRHNLGNTSLDWSNPIVDRHRQSAASLGFKF